MFCQIKPKMSPADKLYPEEACIILYRAPKRASPLPKWYPVYIYNLEKSFQRKGKGVFRSWHEEEGTVCIYSLYNRNRSLICNSLRWKRTVRSYLIYCLNSEKGQHAVFVKIQIQNREK